MRLPSMASLAKVSSWRLWLGAVAIAWLVALILWTPYFGQLPSGLNRDEAALGYNAYSLLKTGKDEWGNTWPVSIASFGDQKLPGYVYTLIPFIALFGLETWVIRLPSLIAGLFVLVGMGLIAGRVIKSLGGKKVHQVIFGLAVMISVAASPWHLHFSRVAYEAHLAMALFTIGVSLFLFGIDEKKQKLQKWLLVGAATTWSLTLLTYHSYQLFLPFFLVCLGVLYLPTLKKIPRTTIALCFGIGIFASSLLVVGGVLQANSIKNRGISPYSTQKLLNKATVYRGLGVFNPPLAKIFFNKVTEGTVTFAQNYLTVVSGTFFFVHGSGHGDHNPGKINNFHLLAAPGILLGVLALWEYRRSQSVKVLILWLVLAVIPSSLTIEPLHEIRLATIFPLLDLLAVAGFVFAWQRLPVKLPKTPLVLAMGGLVFLSVMRTYVTYTSLAPQTADDKYPYHLLAQALAKYSQDGQAVITQSLTSSPYIWYLVVNKIDPAFTHQQLVHYPPTEEGFHHVNKIGSISFESINWDDLAVRSQTQPLILIVKPSEMPDEHRINPASSFVDAITYKDTTLYEIWRFSAVPPENAKK